MDFKYVNEISCEDYNRLRDEIKWGALPEEQAKTGLKNSACIVACKDEEKVIATARLLWDGGYAAYICDVMVSPQYQHKGIGSEMMNQILKYLQLQIKEGWRIMVALVSAHGKEPFYEKVGFVSRPNEQFGAGMSQWIG